MEIADNAVSVSNANRSRFDRYTGTYDHMCSIPENLTCVRRAHKYFGASGLEKRKEIQPDIPDSRNASRSTNYVPYELSEC